MRKGQISLEFMFLFMIFVLMLVYSLKLTSFSSSPSQDVLAAQIGVEAKGLASSISNAISQVYAQGPGAKVTTYYRLTYLRDPNYIEKAFFINNPIICISYRNGTYVMLLNGTEPISVNFEGVNKNAFFAMSLYRRDFLTNTTVFPDQILNVNFGGTFVNLACVKLSPANLPKMLKIVVEWNPEIENIWQYNSTSQEIVININPGG
ncbi:class III signal peptide-containing protein [Pyrococcus sp. ST04]|uniref:class III signal peptide-containing protein n=1 Tax=Pyrococcus sp. ST04 TaxID=1183377 RepID=UPI0002605B19|nr:class III signal peptide-containing protein [Pyrococcus sp. ST04]AFK22822.1 hypothetical protein Py04_1248 [Pyrococcus sp. ST04]